MVLAHVYFRGTPTFKNQLYLIFSIFCSTTWQKGPVSFLPPHHGRRREPRDEVSLKSRERSREGRGAAPGPQVLPFSEIKPGNFPPGSVVKSLAVVQVLQAGRYTAEGTPVRMILLLIYAGPLHLRKYVNSRTRAYFSFERQ